MHHAQHSLNLCVFPPSRKVGQKLSCADEFSVPMQDFGLVITHPDRTCTLHKLDIRVNKVH